MLQLHGRNRNPYLHPELGRPLYSEVVRDIHTGRLLKKVMTDSFYKGPSAEAMARQYFNCQLADSLIVAQSITPSTTKTFMLTQSQANQCLPVGYGQGAPFAGQIYHFAMGGIVTTASTGTLIIDPTFGNGTSTTAGGVSMGASPAQTTTASLSSQPWRLTGELVFRTISGTATTSTAWLTGTFVGQGTLATAGGGWAIPFGSTAAVSVDTTGTAAAGSFGALNFYVTFSVTGATIVTEWTSMQSYN